MPVVGSRHLPEQRHRDSGASAIFRRQTSLLLCYRSPAPVDRYSGRVAFRPVAAELGWARSNREAASMANLPDAWVEDARNLDNAEQLLHSAHDILLETPAIGDFLRNETNKRIVVAPKGYGKTFLLKSKRILLQRNSENLSCLPDNQLVAQRFPTAQACHKPMCSVLSTMHSGARFGRPR
jgi:hypothetical protein